MCENKPIVFKVIAAVAAFLTTVIVVKKVRKVLAARKAEQIANEASKSASANQR